MSDEFRQRLDAVEDWSKRIVPLIREAVAKANSQIAEKKMCRSPSSPELRSSRVTPTEMQDFPGIRIIARPEFRRICVPKMLSSAAVGRKAEYARGGPSPSDDQDRSRCKWQD